MRNLFERLAPIVSLIVILLWLSACIEKTGNLLENGGFERDYFNQIAMWGNEAHIYSTDAVRFFVKDNEGHSGTRCAAIANLVPNDSKIIQWVKVKPNSLYRLSCWIKAVEVEGGNTGANISVLGIGNSSPDFKDTAGEWVYTELYGRTGSQQNELAVVARLGFYGSLVRGLAYFDDIGLEEVGSLPADSVLVLNFFDESKDSYKPRDTLVGTLVLIGVLVLILSAAVLAGIFLYIKREFLKDFLRKFFKGKKVPVSGTGKERRLKKRLIKEMEVLVRKKYKRGQYEEIEFRSHDISEGGIFITTDDLSQFKLNEEVQVDITYEGNKYSLGKAKITRKQKRLTEGGIVRESGYGLAFLELKTSIWKAIASAF
ncbi:MAG: PilZ domain-containing protein [Spirochaetales bacterium]|nr:PilZ domain-containing protein [Spirochaetales bacterium]